MRLLMIDNYDSFTYNLVQYFAELGAAVVVLRNDERTVPEILGERPDVIVISPGPGRPENAGICVELIGEAAGKIPLLGVCLGHQAIALAFGGSVTYAPSIMHGKVSSIEHDSSTLFSGIPNPFEATRYHSLVIDPAHIPTGFSVTARTRDGVIMAVADESRRAYGVQFHPESIMTKCGMDILRNFLSSVPTGEEKRVES